MTTRSEYSNVILEICGCTCHPKVIIQELDDKGSFDIKHEHDADCAKTINAKQWKARSLGGPPDLTTENERRSRRRAFLDANPRRP